MKEFNYTIDEPINVFVELPPDPPIGVYIKTDSNNNVIEINSSRFIHDLSGWIKIDEGFGDRFAHAQSQYFEKQLFNESGGYTYQYINGTIIEK